MQIQKNQRKYQLNKLQAYRISYDNRSKRSFENQ